jgi:16S rRNA processing protein RimM
VAIPPGERVTVGLVRGLHGLRGAVRIEVLSDQPGRFDPGRVVFVEGRDEPLTVAWAQPSKPGLLLSFEELLTREAVEPLRDRYLEAIPVEPLPPGTWYWHQIHGLEVRTTTGEVLGTVSDVFRAGEAEVYVVHGGPRGEILVPAVKSVVTELAPDEGHITVDAMALALPDQLPSRRRRERSLTTGEGDSDMEEGGGEVQSEAEGAAP